VNKIISLFV
jgi:hypothetical protein